MSEFIFIYGTLRPECAPGEVAAAAEKLRLVGAASVCGELYDLGQYPGAVLSDEADCRIFGLLFELPEDASLLRALDAYEEFYPESPQTSLFLRVMCEAALETGETMPCWIYVYAQGRTGARRIVDGRWSGPVR